MFWRKMSAETKKRSGAGFAARDKFDSRAVSVLATLIFCIAFFAAAAAQTRFRLVPPSTVKSRVKSFSTNNTDREALIHKWLADSGCNDNLTEQSIVRKLPPNVICVLPGETHDVILVGAHTDHVTSYGD